MILPLSPRRSPGEWLVQCRRVTVMMVFVSYEPHIWCYVSFNHGQPVIFIHTDIRIINTLDLLSSLFIIFIKYLNS